ncbi:MAG: transporter permease [Bacillales bacterium]|jgi:putative ABC transport system permease protein|nr:transporter permease [Bacillales bacterium]
MDVLVTAISQGLLWSMLAMGVFLTFRILDIADLTAEGSFPLGAAVGSILILDGMSPLLATCIAILAGMAAGFVTGILYTKLKIPALLSGILTMTALYSINLRIMGRANLSLIGQKSVFDLFSKMGISDNWIPIVIGLILVSIVIFLLFLFFNTELGFVLRATGDNEQMVRAQGANTDTLKILGLMISNGLIAFSGALIAQDNGYADISMGIGTIVIGLASVIVGEVLFGNLTIAKRLICVVLGSTIYRMIIALVLNLGMAPTDLKLISAILLVIALSSPLLKGVLQKNVGKRGLLK